MLPRIHLDSGGRRPPGGPIDLSLAWDLAELAAGDAWFGSVTLGSSSRSAGDVGSFIVSLRHP